MRDFFFSVQLDIFDTTLQKTARWVVDIDLDMQILMNLGEWLYFHISTFNDMVQGLDWYIHTKVKQVKEKANQ